MDFKDYLIRTLQEERLWKEGECDTFTFGDWRITLRKEEKQYHPLQYAINGERVNGAETWSRRYTSMEKAFLHILNDFNENVRFENKYESIADFIASH